MPNPAPVPTMDELVDLAAKIVSDTATIAMGDYDVMNPEEVARAILSAVLPLVAWPAGEALKPLAAKAIPMRPRYNAGAYSFLHSEIVRARTTRDQLRALADPPPRSP